MAGSVERPTSAQVMISRFTGSSPASDSVLTAQGLEPTSDSVSPSLSVPPALMLCLSLFLTAPFEAPVLPAGVRGLREAPWVSEPRATHRQPPEGIANQIMMFS